MANTQAEIDEQFLVFVHDRGHITALEAEGLRSELRRRKAVQKNLTMHGLLIHKGHLTQQHADGLYVAFNERLARPASRYEAPQVQPQGAPELVSEDDSADDDTARASKKKNTDRHTDRRQTKQVEDPLRPADKRPTTVIEDSDTLSDSRPTDMIARDEVAPPQRPTDKKDPGKVTTARNTGAGKESGWSLHRDTDALSASDREVPAGTIISGSDMTIAQVRVKVGLDEGVKLVSDKMQSTLAQFQPDATADKKRYVVIREIARGGMGKVLEVEDTELRRSVALKVLRKELIGRRDVVERFLEEAQITGQLEHPNIVPVHEMGVDGAGNLYFTMKYVEGLSLSEVMLRLREGNRDAKREYPLLRMLDVFVKICEGMAFAHNRGVIHRDLKPANIMVGRFGEVQVMDWGVAKVVGRQFRTDSDSGIVLTDRLDTGAEHTMMGAIIGTPSYMSPEQAKGDIGIINHKSDIFSLGVILYEMICLRAPWTGKTSDEVLEQVREMTPIKPRERNPEAEVPAELERLALKCLEKNPEDRVDTVAELAENVRSFIEGRAMGSVEYSALRLASKWVGRNKKEVAGVMLVLVAVVAGVLGTLWYLRKLDQDRVLSLNDDAVPLMAEWASLAEGGNFREAEEKIDEAKNLFQRVLAVDDTDERALSGIEDVKDAAEQIRVMRATSETKAALEKQRNRLIAEAQSAIAAGKSDPLFGYREFEKAYANADAVLALEAGNAEAMAAKAEAANELAKAARDVKRWEIMKLWLDRLEDTKLLPEEHKERLREYEQGRG
jgi:serine/threonine protein kinase